MEKSFAGKIVIITGASSGFGAAIAIEFAKYKAKLLLTARNAERLQAVKDRCVEAGLKENEVVLVCGDIVEKSTETEIINSAVEHFGKIDILINNAGVLFLAPAVETKMEDFDKTIEINLRSHVALSMMAVPHLLKTKGNIVNISSVGGLVPATGFMSYCVAKAGLDMFTKSLAFELASKGVRVNSVNPAIVPTNIFRESNIAEDNTDWWEKLKAIHPMERNGEVKEVVDAVVFLASDHASFTTGQLLAVDGGLAIGGVKF